MNDGRVVIVGAGPAGLTSAHVLVQAGVRPVVFEQGLKVGGLARTEEYKGYRFDIGGHRFLTKVPEVEALWREILGIDLLRVRRLSRIYDDGRFFDYPLNLGNVLRNIDPIEGLLFLSSYLRAKVRPVREETFEDWVINRFGARLYDRFFKGYTEKVWGLPGRQIRADWAAQRIRGLSLLSVVRHAFTGNNDAKSLTGEFLYPRLGPGQMWERFASLLEAAGGELRLNTEVVRVDLDGRRVAAVTARTGSVTRHERASAVVTSMPLSALVARLRPQPPPEVLRAARGLRYRDFLVVGLIVRRPHLFPDNWIYVNTPRVRVGRIQNFKNWSPAMVPDAERTSLGMEYFCSIGDDLWSRPDEEILALATREIDELGLAKAADVEDGCVIRQPKAYPVYDGDYRRHVDVIRRHLDTIEGLHAIGRNGMHRYNNQDHSMLTGWLAARNVLGEQHDLWGGQY